MRSLLERVLRTIWTAVVNFAKDDGFNRAAALAFYAIVSVGPALYLIGRVAESWFNASDAISRLTAGGAEFVPPAIVPILDRVASSLRLGGGLEIVAIPALLWVSRSAFAALSRSINVAFGVDPTFRFWMSQLKTFVAAMASGLLLILAGVSGQVLGWLDEYQAGIEATVELPRVATWGGYVLAWSFGFSGFLLFYKLLPHAGRGRAPRHPPRCGSTRRPPSRNWGLSSPRS